MREAAVPARGLDPIRMGSDPARIARSRRSALFVRAVASQYGWGHPLLFAIVSYCGCAISASCFGVAVVLLIRSSPSLQRAGR
jgi:hypothetical protein